MSQGFASLFDKIEGDDDNTLSWEEFEKFFVAAGISTHLPMYLLDVS